MKSIVVNVFYRLRPWRFSQQKLENDGTNRINIALLGNFVLFLVEIGSVKVLDFMLGLINFAISLVGNISKFCGHLHLFWRNIILVTSAHVEK